MTNLLIINSNGITMNFLYSKLTILLLISIVLISNPLELASKSPYNSTWTKESIIFGSNIGFILLSEALSEGADTMTIAQINALDKSNINSFDRSTASNWSPDIARASDYIVAATIITPFTLLLSEDVREDVGTVTVMYLQTVLSATFITSSIKSVSRIRPLAYNPDTSLDDKLRLKQDLKGSFPSGHTAWAFSSAVFFSTVYSDYYPDSDWTPYIWGGSLVAASAVGLFRQQSGYHFPTDVLVGAALGSLLGYTIPYLHRKSDNKDLSITPLVSPNYTGIGLHYEF